MAITPRMILGLTLPPLTPALIVFIPAVLTGRMFEALWAAKAVLVFSIPIFIVFGLPVIFLFHKYGLVNARWFALAGLAIGVVLGLWTAIPNLERNGNMDALPTYIAQALVLICLSLASSMSHWAVVHAGRAGGE